MTQNQLVSAAYLASRIGQPDLLVVDCRFDLGNVDAGRAAYLQGHIPGSVFADLNLDLSDLSRVGMGRHPFPSDEDFSALLSRWGCTPDTEVICYDARESTMAARLWWMLDCVGHKRVAILDGGLEAWLANAGALETHSPARTPVARSVHFDPQRFASFDEVAASRSHGGLLLIDARPPARFRGEQEPIDPVPGHIPGARNRPCGANLQSDGRFKTPENLRSEFAEVLQSQPADAVASMCGSGVTGCHNLFAMQLAGLPKARLFAPSWSGWISDPSRAIARGEGENK